MDTRGRRFESCIPDFLWGLSSAGRAPALHAGGQRFDSDIFHNQHFKSASRRLHGTRHVHNVNSSSESFWMSVEQGRIVGNQGQSINQLTGDKSTVDVVVGKRF